VPDDMLLIGMVGQFKPQKAYTRAVRVLHRVQQQKLPLLLSVRSNLAYATTTHRIPRSPQAQGLRSGRSRSS
jgi:hypothetical protein